jgi:[protein-PII] uridylyltransferase
MSDAFSHARTAASSNDKAHAYQQWFDLTTLDAAEQDEQPEVAYRVFLSRVQQILAEKFSADTDVVELIHARSWVVDQVLTRCWKSRLDGFAGALLAVGGYGRSELMPGSDVDIMVLLPRPENGEIGNQLEDFLTLLWDIGLEVGHSVRTLEDCYIQARDDVTVATNLMEARLIYGSEALFNAMRERVAPDQIWPSQAFFEAKLEEQQARYARFGDAIYNLEPNIKEGPGGLRDAQMIAWIFKRHFGSDRLSDLIGQEFITTKEYQTLMHSQRFLWRVRFGLHQITGRREDRLLFDHQRTLAELFGYCDRNHRLAVEWFMKDYYRAIEELNRLNEMLLQLFKEAILYPGDEESPVVINRRFQSRKGFLEVTYKKVFEYYPFALLELFLVMQQNPELQGVRASTIRLVRQYLHIIDDDFRNDIRCRSLFMEIFRQPRGLTHELRRMNRYGVLAAYYPQFGNIVGQMQHDLFHAYTVDEHTLFVIRNLRRFSVKKHMHEYPACSRISESIPKPELLYLAGFFHDIAKGRGGDHAKLGAADAGAFLKKHDLSAYDCNLVAWLVENHLMMSHVAQRRDIADPDVINEFARLIGDRNRLDYLYLLTVADIRATNPNLWNNWKDVLFKDLYNATRHALIRGLENPLHREELILDIKHTALTKLTRKGYSPDSLVKLWNDFPEDYFLRNKVNEVIWHAEAILESGSTEGTHVALQPRSERGSTALFIHTPVYDRLFIQTTGLIDQLGLNVTDARIFTSDRGYAIDTYHILNTSGEPVSDHYQLEEIQTLITRALQSPADESPLLSRPAPRRLRHFKVATRVNFQDDPNGQRTIVELFTTDSPGLLSRVGRIFFKQGVQLQNAKIATFGSRAEDVFYVTDEHGKVLTPEQQNRLRSRLIEDLDETD